MAMPNNRKVCGLHRLYVVTQVANHMQRTAIRSGIPQPQYDANNRFCFIKPASFNFACVASRTLELRRARHSSIASEENVGVSLDVQRH